MNAFWTYLGLPEALSVAFFLSAIGVLAGYLRRYHTPLDAWLPLPLAGRPLAALCPPPKTFALPEASPHVMRRFLELSVRKGETFLYFGEENPWGNRDSGAAGPRYLLQRDRAHAAIGALPRWSAGPWAMGAIPLLVVPGPRSVDPLFAFESAWFGRGCVVVRDPAAADAWLRELHDWLRLRQSVRAVAWRPVNLVWNHVTPMDPARTAGLRFLCEQTGLRLVTVQAKKDFLLPQSDETLKNAVPHGGGREETKPWSFHMASFSRLDHCVSL